MTTTDAAGDIESAVKPRVFPGKQNVVKFPNLPPLRPESPVIPDGDLFGATDQPLPSAPPGHGSVGWDFIFNSSSRPGGFHENLCAPYPPCHPLGCGEGIAPANCEECDSTSVAFTIVGLCLLAVLIVFTNVLVIVIIMRNESLRRRHGLIKISLAASDLLIGLFVIPAAAYNLATTMYFPAYPGPQLEPSGRLWKPTPLQTREFIQKNSLASIFFGTILIISLTSSIYNLLLLSFDRFLAVARPLQSRSEKYFSKKKLKICIVVVWMFGLVLSSLPAFIPSLFSYQLDGTTFLYVQTANYDSAHGVGPIALFSLFVMGVPYLSIIVLNFSTMFLTIKKLKFSARHSSTRRKTSEKTEQANRLKLILETCPEMNYEESNITRFKRWVSRNNNNSTGVSRDRFESVNSVMSRMKSVKNSAEKMNARVTRMILTMVLAFTLCICPYIVVNVLIYQDFLNCANLGTIYNVAVYLLLLNSAMNFFIYNFWHKEFRIQLLAALSGRQPVSSQGPSTRKGIVTSLEKQRLSSGPTSSLPRKSPAQYHTRKMGGISSFQSPAVDTRL